MKCDRLSTTLAERERLKRRIATITGTQTARDLRQYRTFINRKEQILKRAVSAVPKQTDRGVRYQAVDEILLCHRFLDTQGVDPMFE